MFCKEPAILLREKHKLIRVPEALKLCHKCSISVWFSYNICEERRLSYRILIHLNYSDSARNTYMHINGKSCLNICVRQIWWAMFYFKILRCMIDVICITPNKMYAHSSIFLGKIKTRIMHYIHRKLVNKCNF